MARMPHAAKVLRNQINDKLRRSPDSEKGAGTFTAVGDPDGLDVVRSFELDPQASKIVKALVDGGWDDPRISGVEVAGAKNSPKVTLTFASGISADRRDPFPVDGAGDVADEESDQT